ncbi:MAG: efflux transporter outer membrane subunit [Janthinobacterium lividum]
MNSRSIVSLGLSAINLGSSASLVGAAALLSACGAFGPDRSPPAMPSTAHYSVSGQPTQLPLADGVAQQLMAGARPVPEWWRAYGSPALDALVAEGLAHSPSLGASQHTLKSAQEQLRSEIGDSLYPNIDASFSPSRQRALGLPILPQQTFVEDIFSAQLKASYTFDFFGASILGDRALEGQVEQQVFQFEATRRTLAANIVTGTIRAAALQAQVDATTTLVALGEQRARQTASRYQLGGVSQDDVLAAEQDAANAAATLPGLRAQLLAVRHAQAVLLGRLPSDAPAPLPLESLHVPVAVPVAIPSELLRQRPDILAAEAAVRAAADNAGAATASMFPTLKLSASYGRGGFDWSTFTSPAGMLWGVGASLTQPLFHGGALVARKRQYQATYEAAISQYKQTVLAAFQNVADTLSALDEDANTVTQTRRAADAAQRTGANTEARYKLGAMPFYATLTAAQQYQSARVQYVRAQAARLTDTATLFEAMGNPPVAAGAQGLHDESLRLGRQAAASAIPAVAPASGAVATP